jgi:uncharacterized protein (TIGR03437 family)
VQLNKSVVIQSHQNSGLPINPPTTNNRQLEKSLEMQNKMSFRKNFASLLILSTAGCSLAIAQTTATYGYSGAPLPIIYSPSTGTVMNISVPAALSISTVTTTVNINYPSVGDLNVFLFGPDGTRTKLVERNCGGTATATLVNTTFDDSAQSKYSDFCPVQSGRTFYGNEPLANFKGKVSSGVWSLAVQNNVNSANFGTIDGFSLTFNGTNLTPTTVSGVVNAVSYAVGAIAPGELIAIGGANLGPTTGVISTATALPLTLGGAQITINDQPIPLYFVSSTLVAGVVPYQAIPGNPAVIGGQVTIKAIYNGITSNGLVTNLTSSSPALFSGSSGTSPLLTVKAINQDGTTNSSASPAAVGSYVTLYASGLGPVTPTGFAAGTRAPNTPLYTTVTPTFASITGQSATVLFAGLAPGTISSYQVNIQVPAGTPSGAQPIVVSNAVGASQPSIYIWIN